MPTVMQGIARPLDDPAGLARAVDELLDDRHVQLVGLGEPTHGVAAFPLLRNDLFAHLVHRGFRSVALETDYHAASAVDDYIGGATTNLDDVLASGFSHGFGRVAANRELVEWLRRFNAERPAPDRVKFYGFDAPVEYAGAPSPRRYVFEAQESLDDLLGDDADWTNPQAMYDASASIGRSDRARALRVVAENMTPSPHARTALGLLSYHEAMATPGPDRMDRLLGVRAKMMAENLLGIVADEQDRGTTLVFAHNAHLHRGPVTGGWANAGALVANALVEHYTFVAADGNPRPTAGTLQSMLSDATIRRAMFPSPALRDALPPAVEPAEQVIRGHIPLTSRGLHGIDAVVFVADTDFVRQQYW